MGGGRRRLKKLHQMCTVSQFWMSPGRGFLRLGAGLGFVRGLRAGRLPLWHRGGNRAGRVTGAFWGWGGVWVPRCGKANPWGAVFVQRHLEDAGD
jgi:hypothetical protein